MSKIHPTAIVAPTAELGENVSIGPYAIIEDNVRLGAGCTIAAHAVIKCESQLGSNNRVFEGAVLGGIPQHLALTDEMGGLRIGDGNVFRENCTIHRAYVPHENTTIGDRNMIMVNAHIAHDCHLQDDIILANNVMLAGHVDIANRAYVSGAVGIHQFCRIGRNAMVGGHGRVTRDVPPFMTLDGLTNCIVGLNLIGLRRSGMNSSDIRTLKAAYRTIFRSDLHWDEILAQLTEQFADGPAAELAPFLESAKRGIMRSRSRDVEASVSLDKPRRGAETNSPVTVRFPKDEAA